jgi:hypothetical protein
VSLPSIPDTVPWVEAKAFIERIGVDPHSVRALEITVDGVWVTVYATTPDGRRIAADGDAACHKLFIPFEREGG